MHRTSQYKSNKILHSFRTTSQFAIYDVQLPLFDKIERKQCREEEGKRVLTKQNISHSGIYFDNTPVNQLLSQNKAQQSVLHDRSSTDR